jgi:hypothetical protein
LLILAHAGFRGCESEEDTAGGVHDEGARIEVLRDSGSQPFNPDFSPELRVNDFPSGFLGGDQYQLKRPADSDAGRALSSLETFTSELRKLDIGKVLGHKV